ncbi:MATE family efflux transporter [Pseudohalioglobus sediminis]|nr:polysaccharide biosynthesis C-terminal domain-containing protein [Pseudohalioglobus sediminis]
MAKITGFATSVIIARNSTAEVFGVYTVFFTVYVISATVVDQLDNAMIISANSPGNAKGVNEYILPAVVAKLLIVTAFLVLASLSFAIDSMLFQASCMGVALGAISSLYNTKIAAFRARLDFRGVALRQPLPNLVVFVIALVFLWRLNHYEKDSVIVVYMASAIILSSIPIFSVLKDSTEEVTRALKRALRLLHAATPLIIYAAISLTGNRLDVLLASEFVTTSEIGYYGIAVRVSIIAAIFNGVLVTITLPSAPFALLSKFEFRQYLKKFLFLVCLQTSISLIVIMSTPLLVSILFGPYPNEVATLAALVIFQSMLLALSTPLVSLLQSARRNFDILLAAFVKLVSATILLILLVPKYGILGAAVGSILSAMIFFVCVGLQTSSLYRTLSADLGREKSKQEELQ